MALNGGGDIHAALASGGTVTGRISPGATLTATLGTSAPSAVPYAGPYEATPTQEEQVFPTAGKTMLRSFVVDPIPSNYGLISWNGSVLTVS